MPILLASCISYSGPEKSLLEISSHAGPKQALEEHLKFYKTMRDQGVSTRHVRLEIEKLADKYPNNASVLEANALVAFESRELEKAQNFLDRASYVDPNRPEGVVLRSKIALEKGNVTLARRILNEQIRRTPNHAGLRETLAGVLFFEKKYDQAKEVLNQAYKLGAPRQRINYHLGLIAESMNEPEEAKKHYREALKGDTPFEAAHQRLNALKAL